jgi:hypothetical protein
MLTERQMLSVYDDPWYGHHRVVMVERITLPPGTLFFVEDDMMCLFPTPRRLVNEGELLIWLGDSLFLSKTGVIALYDESYVCFFTDEKGVPL